MSSNTARCELLVKYKAIKNTKDNILDKYWQREARFLARIPVSSQARVETKKFPGQPIETDRRWWVVRVDGRSARRPSPRGGPRSPNEINRDPLLSRRTSLSRPQSVFSQIANRVGSTTRSRLIYLDSDLSGYNSNLHVTVKRERSKSIAPISFLIRF